MSTFFIKTGSGGSSSFGPLYLDDIYIEDTPSLNLSNPVPPLVGDYNLDGDVNIQDYAVWTTEFGVTGGSDADGNADAVVDPADFTVWRDHASDASQAGIVASCHVGS